MNADKHFLTWTLMQSLDYHSTLQGITAGIKEQNPIVQQVLASTGMTGLIAIKIMLLLYILQWLRKNQEKKLCGTISTGLIGIYAFVVITNYATLIFYPATP